MWLIAVRRGAREGRTWKGRGSVKKWAFVTFPAKLDISRWSSGMHKAPKYVWVASIYVSMVVA